MTETANKTAKLERINPQPVRRDRDGALITFFKVGGFAVDFVTPDGMDESDHEELADIIGASMDILSALVAVRRDHLLQGVECCCKPGVAAKCIVCTVESAISKAVPNG